MATVPVPWTPKDDRKILLSRGADKVLAAELGRTTSAIYSRRAYLRDPKGRRLSKTRVPKDKQKERQRQAKYYELGRANLSAHRSSWLRKDEVAILADERPPDHVLAEQLGRSVRAIQARRHRLLHPEET